MHDWSPASESCFVISERPWSRPSDRAELSRELQIYDTPLALTDTDSVEATKRQAIYGWLIASPIAHDSPSHVMSRNTGKASQVHSGNSRLVRGGRGESRRANSHG